MNRSTQWDIVGIIALVIALSSLICLFRNGGFIVINNIGIWFGNPFIMGFAVLFGFMCFIFGFFEGNKEKKKLPNP